MARKHRPPAEPVEADIVSLTPEGRGLTQIAGKTVFVDGALAGERVRFRYTRNRRRFDEGQVIEVLEAAPERVVPRCPHFGVCGGCRLQHLAPEAQIARKQALLAEVLRAIGHVEPQHWLPPLAASPWGYRRKARLGVRHVLKKGRTLVGFRERGTSLVADLEECPVLHPDIGTRLAALRTLMECLTRRERIPQIEFAKGEGPGVLVLRTLDPLDEEDVARLQAFAAAEGVRFFVQEAGPESIRPLPGQATDLYYRLPAWDLRLHFQPTDFTQVNLEVNRLMVAQALEWLDPQPEESILDLFCGLGNFTLPLARHAALVVGVEGDAGLVARARRNAAVNGLGNVRFEVADLQGRAEAAPWPEGRFVKALLDPPRSGALEILDRLPAAGVRRLVYVSCFPPTLARDADRLVRDLGYRFLAAGAMDMFPHTAHLESMAVFERE